MTENGNRRTTITIRVKTWRRLQALRNGPEDDFDTILNNLLDDSEARD